MPGTATMGANLVDEMVTVADEARALRGELGADPYRIYVVVRTWSGTEPGDGTPVDVEARELTPTPLVAELDLQRRWAPHGNDEAGMVRLHEVSLTYTQPELVPSINANQELLYKLVPQHGQGSPTRWFTLAAPPVEDRAKTIGWIMKLRKVEA
jgi:hypothetical protein